MLLKLISDCHLEFLKDPLEFDCPNNGADVLILGGDIIVADKVKKFIPWFERICSQYPEVIFIMGNHCHYGYSLHLSYNKLKKHLGHIPNLHILENEFRIFDNVMFVGCTLWTDANKGDPITKRIIQGCMNDYRLIRYGKDNNFRVIGPQDTINIHHGSVAYIRKLLEEKKCDRVVLVTHHGISSKSITEEFKDDYYVNGAYISDLSNLILDFPEIKLSTHGHIHQSVDYMIGDTRVLTNPHGYGNENRNFNPNLIVEI